MTTSRSDRCFAPKAGACKGLLVLVGYEQQPNTAGGAAHGKRLPPAPGGIMSTEDEARRLVLVRWVDSAAPASGWDRSDQPWDVANCVSVGWVLQENERCLVVVPHRHAESETICHGVAGVMVIAKCQVQSIEALDCLGGAGAVGGESRKDHRSTSEMDSSKMHPIGGRVSDAAPVEGTEEGEE